MGLFISDIIRNPLPAKWRNKIKYKLNSIDVFKIESQINVNSDEFKANKEAFLELLKNYKKIHREITKGGPDKAIEKHKKRGKLLGEGEG